LYHRFTVSLRDVEEMLLYRGIVVSYETIRKWGLKFGQAYANSIKQRAPDEGISGI
jgi:putative transposase